jgi:hypothetical protein
MTTSERVDRSNGSANHAEGYANSVVKVAEAARIEADAAKLYALAARATADAEATKADAQEAATSLALVTQIAQSEASASRIAAAQYDTPVTPVTLIKRLAGAVRPSRLRG